MSGVGRKPLTLEQLVDLGVKAESGENHIVYCTPLNDWCKVFKYGLMFFGTEDYRSWREVGDTYGKEWLACAYPPARIDREKWGPCEHCKPDKCPPGYCDPHTFPVAGNTIRYYDINEGTIAEEIDFCPWCSRPLTDKAWAELERRVCGEV